jgi:hypothetical protein
VRAGHLGRERGAGAREPRDANGAGGGRRAGGGGGEGDRGQRVAAVGGVGGERDGRRLPAARRRDGRGGEVEDQRAAGAEGRRVERRGRGALGDLREQRLTAGRRRGDGEQEQEQDWLGLPHFDRWCVGRIDAVMEGTYVRPIYTLDLENNQFDQCMAGQHSSRSVLLDEPELHFSTLSITSSQSQMILL